MIVGIHHAQITIPTDTEAEARRFYCNLLQLPEINKPESLKSRGGIWLEVGDRQLHIGTEDGVNRQETKAHIAYQVSNLDQWRARLTQHEVTIIESIPIPGYERFEFRDPFGNRIELIAESAT